METIYEFFIVTKSSRIFTMHWWEHLVFTAEQGSLPQPQRLHAHVCGLTVPRASVCTFQGGFICWAQGCPVKQRWATHSYENCKDSPKISILLPVLPECWQNMHSQSHWALCIFIHLKSRHTSVLECHAY